MDEFGVLVESIGFKAQGKSTPMADLKTKTNTNNRGSRNFGINSSSDLKPTSVNQSKSVYTWNSTTGSFDGDIHGNFRSSNNRKAGNLTDFDGFDDVFGEPVKTSKPSGGDGFDLDSIFKGSNNFSVRSSVYDDEDDDIFGVMPGLKSSTAVNNDDLLGNFGGMGLGSNGLRKNLGEMEQSDQNLDDLIPGFGGSSTSSNGENAKTSCSPLSSGRSAKSTSTSSEDPFVVLEQSPSQAYTSGLFSEPVEQYAGKSSVLSSVDELEDFAMGKVRNNANEQSDYSPKERVETATHDLDFLFNMGAQPSSGSRHKSTMADPVFDSLFQSRGDPGVKRTPSMTSSGAKKAFPTTNIVDDFSLFFGAAPSCGEFQEIEGESEERRKARLNHHMRTQQRMAKALAEKNQRDLQTQLEQEERHVLWPECRWQPVSLIDLITSVSVKKVYYKATLYVHPDKVQQKGADIQQKYIAEKVFDVLKEAWNKFNSEEL
ncbi:auxilin-related protein 1 isoform X2 [Camellia sinensis]|uniref:auxilin-related protein 1 isoform X2 n=1 Tax=Camellia sinensis TaxID=4442 RepID=UPI0010356B38|nr:auxilin-related protein 1 isoform X2 [Camellia sinensis]